MLNIIKISVWKKIAVWCEEDFKKQPSGKKNRFNNFNQRQYDFNSLEKNLLEADQKKKPEPTPEEREALRKRVQELKKELGA